MSRILRRPMFRGGRVDSRGTGITSGLSYQKGGRVGYFQDQPGGVVLGKDLIANNIFSGTPQSKDYMDKKDFYKNYKIRSAEDIAEDYEDMMRQKEDDLTMTFGIDDYSGFQNKVAEDLDYYRDPKGGMMKFFQEEKAKDDAARIEAKKYEVELPELINSQTEELPQELTQAQLENIELRKLLEERMSKGTPEEEIEKKKEMFKKAYGSGVADDASTMALSFAGKALKPEATVKSAFSEFFEDESKRPSESKKYKDAATTAAINAYLTGQSSFQKFEDQLKLTQAGIDMKLKAGQPSNLDEALEFFRKTGDKLTSPGLMAKAVDKIYGANTFAGPLIEDKTQLIIGKVYYADDPNNSSNKVLFLIDENQDPQPIKTVYK